MLPVIVESFKSLCRFSAGVHRLHAFAGTLDAQGLVSTSQDPQWPWIEVRLDMMWSLSKLSVYMPLCEHQLFR